MNIFYKIGFKIQKILQHKRTSIIKKELKYCGANSVFHPSCHFLNPECLEIGANTSISSFTTIFSAFGVKIGDNCLISSNVGVSSINHIQNSLNRAIDDDPSFSKPVTIGNNVWIGMNACILPGVTIGDNSIVGSGSVVTKNIPANEIWAGNPARFIKKLDIV